jgi:hypothetical protein
MIVAIMVVQPHDRIGHKKIPHRPWLVGDLRPGGSLGYLMLLAWAA